VPERLIPIPLQTLAPGRIQTSSIRRWLAQSDSSACWTGGGEGKHGEEQLLVADVLRRFLLVDVASGAVRYRFDLSTSAVVPSTYPIRVL